MSDDQLEKLLAEYAKKEPNNSRLQNIEANVWRAIHKNEYDSVLSWKENIISVFSFPQFQVSALSFALLLGIGISPLFTDQVFYKDASLENVLNMKVFTVNTPFLTANLIDTIK